MTLSRTTLHMNKWLERRFWWWLIPLAVAGVVMGSLAGCVSEEERKAMAINDDWSNAPKEYVCTAEQMKVVEADTKFCNENTSYFSSYCYGTAFIRHCTKRGSQ